MKYTFIVNPKSGGNNIADHLGRQIHDRFRDQPDHQVNIHFTEYAGHARQIASEAVIKGANIVVAAGGDGTVNEVCTSLAQTPVCFGLIPLGSGNGFARSLSIPLKSTAAINKLINPQFKTIDAGKINEHFFFGVAGIGLDANIGYKFQEFGTRGPLPYFYLGLKEYLNYDYEPFTLILDGAKTTICPLLITIANTRQYGNGAIIAPQADCSDGFLDVCIIEKFNVIRGLYELRNLFNGKINTANFYKSFRVNDLEIHRSGTGGLFHVDGEPRYGDKILKIQIIKKALTVCV